FVEEGKKLARTSLRASLDIADSAARTIASGVAMRRISWLQSSTLPAEVQHTIQDLPFDGQGLFSEKTDPKLQTLKDVFPHCHLPTSQTLPALRRGPETLPVRGPAIRPLNSTESLHKVHGSGSSRPSASRSSGIPLPRRLAPSWQLRQPGSVPHSQGHGHVQPSRPPSKHRKVHFGPNTENRLHRGYTGLYPRQGFPPRGSLSNACSRHTQPPSFPN
ncbi:hypothetical protein G0U57_011334, partial [Chelydra serpentina]